MKKNRRHSSTPQGNPQNGARGFAVFALAAGLLLFAQVAAAAAPPPVRAIVWQPFEISLTASRNHPWWEFPVRAAFQHQGSGESLTVEGYWDGERRWVIRAAGIMSVSRSLLRPPPAPCPRPPNPTCEDWVLVLSPESKKERKTGGKTGGTRRSQP